MRYLQTIASEIIQVSATSNEKWTNDREQKKKKILAKWSLKMKNIQTINSPGDWFVLSEKKSQPPIDSLDKFRWICDALKKANITNISFKIKNFHFYFFFFFFFLHQSRQKNDNEMSVSISERSNSVDTISNHFQHTVTYNHFNAFRITFCHFLSGKNNILKMIQVHLVHRFSSSSTSLLHSMCL